VTPGIDNIAGVHTCHAECPCLKEPMKAKKVPDIEKTINDNPHYEQCQSEFTAKNANRILAEKLAKAQLVYSHRCGDDPDDIWDAWTNGEPHGCDTHTARLVCIEEIK
jgi:hypothetical protein